MKRALDALIVLAAAALLLMLALGGVDFAWGAVRIRLHDWIRPLTLLAILAGARIILAIKAPGPGAAGAAGAVAKGGLLTLLIAIAGVYAHYHVRVAGGLDSYGYVSAASLLASGRLTEPQPLVSLLPFEGASTAAAPLGYVPGPDGRTSSPRFPLGLPAVMALFTIFGPLGPFFAPLLMACGTIALAGLLGREPGIPASGLFAAALVAIDPLMVHYGVQPMSDVPATCWLLAAIWVRLERPKWPVLAGVSAGMAMFTRPALLVAAAVLVIVTADRRRLGDTVKFGAILLGFVALQMALNLALYGNANTSGYGPASYMFEVSPSRVAANVSNFAQGLTHTHTPLIWFVWPAALWVLRDRRWAWQMSAVAAGAALPYLFYMVFPDWEASRFLLPTIVLVLILGARAFATAASRLPYPERPAKVALAAVTMLMIAMVCAGASHRFLSREGVYRFGSTEAKYRLVGDWFRERSPERAVVLASLHSGSIRLYGRRETLRWDQIPSGKLGPTLRNLEAAGYVPYLALDVSSEPPLFAERFAAEPDVKTEPVARVRVVNIYRFVSAH